MTSEKIHVGGEYAASAFRQLQQVVKAFADARGTMLSAARGCPAEDILNIARYGNEAEPKDAGPTQRPVYNELLLCNNSPIAHALAARAASLAALDLTPDMVRRAAYVLDDLWNGEPTTTQQSNNEHVAYIQGR